MKQLKEIIQEKLKVNSKTKIDTYSEHPKTKGELLDILKERLSKDKNVDLNDIDVSQIDTMFMLFDQLDPHNIDISKWNVSNVKNMTFMFIDCENFDCDLSEWDVTNVESMYSMFNGCKKFKGEGLENWNVSNKAKNDMRNMFDDCKSLIKTPKWYRE